MRRVTVRWHVSAVDELINLWMASADPDRIRRAEYEIDVLLQVDPSTKGRGYALPLLTEAQTQQILERAGALPEDLRMVRCGPLEAFFVAREDDAMAVVFCVALRAD